MHGCNSGSALLVNAEVDSMGGVVDGGVGIGLKTSPRRAAIEKAQAVLRQEYDVREERRKELEFLEKGGNPLDFKFGNAASVSVQSTSLTDQNPEQFVTSEAKGSFALAASPHGDSVDSSGRPGIPTVCEPNTADNLLLFAGDHDLPEAERNSVHPSRRNNITRSEQSSQIDGAQNAKESEDSAIVRPYARRNRSRSNREGARSNTTDVAQNRGAQGSTLPVRGGSRDSKVQISEKNNQKVHNMPTVSNLKSASSNGDLMPRPVASDNQLDADLDGARVPDVKAGPTKVSLDEIKSEVVPPKSSNDSQNNQSTQVESQKTPDVVSGESDVGEKHQTASGLLRLPETTGTMVEEATTQLNGFSGSGENKNALNEVENRKAAVGTKGLDSQSSCNQSSLGLDVNKDSDVCAGTRNVDTDGVSPVKTSDVEGIPRVDGAAPSEDVKKIETLNDGAATKDDPSSVSLSQSGIVGAENMNEDVPENSSELRTGVQIPPNNEGGQLSDHMISETEGKVDPISNNNSSLTENSTRSLPEPLDVSMQEPHGTSLSDAPAVVAPELQTTYVNSLKVSDKAHEDSILEEARIIQAKHKRIAELSVHSLPPENRRKSHWDFVLEEMEWLANDFSQERLWKITAAAQIGYRAAFASRSRLEQQHQRWKLKEIAHDLAKAVMKFWHSAEEPVKEQEVECPKKDAALTVQAYAVRFLKYNSSLSLPQIAEAPATPERVSDLGIQEISWEDHLTEESLFYTVPSGAITTYRKSIEAHLVQFEKTGSSMQEEADTSMYEAGAEYGFQENVYAEDEGETSTYYMPGAFEGNKPSKSTQKKRKHIVSSYPRSYEAGADMPYGMSTSMSQQSTLMVKRPASLNVGAIPTKRMRTASRPRVVTPTANVQVQMKTDASSGDTSSYQDDQSTMHGGSQFQKSMEVESVGDFDKQLAYDCAETSIKPKKKKKAKHMGSAYDQGWQMDSTTLNEQREHSKKRLESHHFDSNGNSGLYMQSNAKKPKMLKHSLENTFDNITGSIPSPVASQNNMSHTNKFIKLIGGRDRSRKSKSLKMSVGQPGSANPWSLFEDQALVVLVHDMGQNWELISDAINSTLQFKCIFRKPKDCKERHKFLMDKSNGDGADSAEDSGSSQPYPSTLPGIPKGSARQLFQRLQEPLEEDTIKSHFEKIIKIGQRQHYRRAQIENQDMKQLAPVHNSHVMALSQVCPNNLNGVLLTPLDFCDTNPSNPEGLPFGCQGGSHSSGLPVPNQGAAAPVLPSPGGNSSLQGSSGAVHGTNLPSPSGALNPSIRDGRYSVPRTSSLPVEEQQRLQPYNHLPGRSMPQSSLPVQGTVPGTDRGVRMIPGGNGMGMMPGMNRNMPIPRPGYQGMNSPSMMNSGSMLPTSMGIPSPANNMHSGPGSAQGNPMIRPREAMHMMRPGHNPEHQRQMTVPELQMQAAAQGNAPFNGLTSGFPNQTTAPTGPSYPVHTQQQQQPHGISGPHHHTHLPGGPNHISGPQQSLAIRRQMQQRYAQQHQHQHQQQQQQFSGPNTLLPHAQNSSQIQSQPQSQPVSMPSSSPMTPVSAQHHHHHQQKHLLPPHAMGRSASQMGGKQQRQRQPNQQHLQQAVAAGRQHPPQQRQMLPAQQQANNKLLKGAGRGGGGGLVQNGLSVPPQGSQPPETMQGQGGAFSGSSHNPMQPPPKPMMVQQKLAPGSAKPDSNPQGQAPPAPSPPPQQHQKQVNQTQQNVQRIIIQQNRQVNPEPPGKSQKEAAQPEQQQQTANNTNQVSGVDSSSSTAVPVCDSNMPKSAVQDSSGSEPTPPARQLSGSLGHNVGAQWQQSQQQPPPPQLQQSQTLPPASQQPEQKSVPNQIPVQQKTQQVGQGMYLRPANSKLE